MISDAPERGIAMLCDEEGVVVTVLRDALDLGEALTPGVLFTRLVDRASLSKALSFLVTLKAQGAAFNWELNLPRDGQMVTLHFAGGRSDDGLLLIVGAANGRNAAALFEDMMRMSNEHVNLLREALKDRTRAEHDAELYNEISRLNNDLVATQRELAKRNAELERLNEEKNRFLGMAAHDLRNPLHLILGHAEFLLDESLMARGLDTRQFLEVIRTSSLFMSNLIDDLLDVAKIESGELSLDLAPVDLEDVVRRNVALNQTLAVGKQTEILLRCAPLPAVVVDAGKMDQVLNNLISNAVKFSPPGSRVEVDLRSEGDRFTISVRDQGPGISEEDQAKLFRPFQRTRARGTAGEKSTGLGLVIVKRIVEGHGGSIWLESCLGEGTTFYVSVPCMPSQ